MAMETNSTVYIQTVFKSFLDVYVYSSIKHDQSYGQAC